MKYITKRSKVEEVTIDLEDGCIIKVTRNNLVFLDTGSIVNLFPYIGGEHKEFSHYEVKLELTNGLSLEFKTLDKGLTEDLEALTCKWSR